MRNGAGRKSHRSIRAIPERPSLSKFYIPASDSFDVKLLLSKGSEFGNYSYSIDGKNLGYFAGAAKLDPPWFDPQPADTIRLGTLYFPKDSHIIAFHCIGKDSASTGFLLDADLLLLTPVTKFSQTLDVSQDFEASPAQSPIVTIYPNPVSSGEINLGVNIFHGSGSGGRFDVIISDILGRKLLSRSDIRLGETASVDVHTFPSGNYLTEFIIHAPFGAKQKIRRMIQVRE